MALILSQKILSFNPGSTNLVPVGFILNLNINLFKVGIILKTLLYCEDNM